MQKSRDVAVLTCPLSAPCCRLGQHSSLGFGRSSVPTATEHRRRSLYGAVQSSPALPSLPNSIQAHILLSSNSVLDIFTWLSQRRENTSPPGPDIRLVHRPLLVLRFLVLASRAEQPHPPCHPAFNRSLHTAPSFPLSLKVPRPGFPSPPCEKPK